MCHKPYFFEKYHLNMKFSEAYSKFVETLLSTHSSILKQQNWLPTACPMACTNAAYRE